MSDLTTVRVGQLPEEVWSGTDNLPHEVGTDLRRGTVSDLATYIAGIIGASSGIAFNPLKITDGQTLPTTTVNEWIIVGTGTYLQGGGFPSVVCVDDIHIVLSDGVSWSLGFGIPLYASVVGGMIDYPELVADGIQDFTIPLGKTAVQVFVNDAIQCLQTPNNTSRGNTFTQSGEVVTLQQPTEINNYITIYYK